MPWAPKTLGQVKRKQPKQRKNSNERGYTYRWSKASRAFVEQQFASGNVHCAACRKLLDGERRDVHVDHIVPHKGNQELFWDEANLQLMCVPCHSRKTLQENRAR